MPPFFRPVFGSKPVQIRATPKAVTPFGGLVCLLEFFNKIGLAPKLAQTMPFTLHSPNAIPPAHTLNEAGAFGFHLHRRFAELCIQNYVVQPQDCHERGKGVENDRLDAAALYQRLDRYERGNKKAFSVVRIPTVDEERERAITRQR